MNILYYNPDHGVPVLGDKGASVHVRAMAQALRDLGHQVLILCATKGAGNKLDGVEIVECSHHTDGVAEAATRLSLGLAEDRGADAILAREVTKISGEIGRTARLERQLGDIGFAPDLIYERHALFHWVGGELAARLGVSRLLEVNAPLVDEQARYRGLRLRAQAELAERANYQSASAIIAVSEAVAAQVRAIVGPAVPVKTVQNGVDLALFRQTERHMLRARLGLEDKTVIGFVGSFKAWHGVMELVDAFASLLREDPCVHLVALGDGPEVAHVRSRIEELAIGHACTLPGRAQHDDVPEWLALMDIVAAPYLAQTDFYFSPLKIIEAQAAGRAVVAPRLGQIGAMIEDDITGSLYAPDDPAGLASSLARLVKEPLLRHRLGRAAREGAIDKDWKHIAGRILSFAAPGGVAA